MNPLQYFLETNAMVIGGMKKAFSEVAVESEDENLKEEAEVEARIEAKNNE